MTESYWLEREVAKADLTYKSETLVFGSDETAGFLFRKITIKDKKYLLKYYIVINKN